MSDSHGGDHGHGHEKLGFFRSYLWSTNHKVIGKQFLITGIVWAIIGGSAAFLFHMTPDLALLMAGAALVMDAVAARRSPDAVRA